MDTTKLTTVISLLIALSIASERLVDIIKGLVPWLNQQRRKPAEEGWRKAALQILAVIAAGITTAWLASAAMPKGVGIPDDWTGTLALGLLASGGSGF
jgi:energy-converting hydrogenase Eha subunit A